MKASWKKRRTKLKTIAGSCDSATRRVFVFLALVLLCSATLAGQSKPKKGESQPRTLTGIVTTPDDKPAIRAVVLLENTKTKSIVSFYSQDDGSYFFHELSPDVDYKISARLNDDISPTKTLSSFDSRKQATINLKLEKKK